jgi:hypothetical protein
MGKAIALRRVCEGHYETYAGGYKVIKDGWFNVWNLYHDGKRIASYPTLKEAKAEIERSL